MRLIFFVAATLALTGCGSRSSSLSRGSINAVRFDSFDIDGHRVYVFKTNSDSMAIAAQHIRELCPACKDAAIRIETNTLSERNQ